MRETELHQSHIPVKVEGRTVGYQETPYITLLSGGNSVTLKGGKAYSLGGDELDLDDLDNGIWAQIERLSEAALASVGINLKDRAPAEIAAKPAGKK